MGSYNFQALLGPKSIPNPSTNTLKHTQKKRKRKTTTQRKPKSNREKENKKRKKKRKGKERKIRKSGETCENDLKQRLR